MQRAGGGEQVDTGWRELMQSAARGPSWNSISTQASLLPALTSLDGLLDSMLPSLERYLEEARRTCPRLYWLPERELLVALSSAGSVNHWIAGVCPARPPC